MIGRFEIELFAILVAGAAICLIGYNESVRYDAMYQRCQDTFTVNELFAQHPVCTEQDQRERFEKADLIRCSSAAFYVRTERPRVCALRAWVHDSWIGEMWRLLKSSVMQFGEHMTSFIAVLVVLPTCALFAYWIHRTEKGKTDREYARNEQFTTILDTMRDMTQRQLQMGPDPVTTAAALRVSAPGKNVLVEDVTDDMRDDD